MIYFILTAILMVAVRANDAPHGDAKYLQIIGQRWETALFAKGACYKTWLTTAPKQCLSKTPTDTVITAMIIIYLKGLHISCFSATWQPLLLLVIIPIMRHAIVLITKNSWSA